MKLKRLAKIFCWLNLLICVGFPPSVFAIRMSDCTRDKQATERLFRAVAEHNLDAIKSALIEGADINAYSDDGTPLLHLAAGDLYTGAEIVRNLLAQDKIDVNIADIFGDTALHMAILNDNINVVRALLIDVRTNVNVRNHERRTPLELALMENKIGIAKVILGRSDVRVLDKNGISCTALEIAREKGEHDMMSMISVKRWLEMTISA